MLDRYKREINYLRVSVTDRCNLRCTYCMPEKGVTLLPANEILSLEEIAEVIKVGAQQFGINKIRLTGGEPLVRKGFVDLVAMIKAIKGVDDITLTTNGIYLSDFAAELKQAGLNSVNISLDTLSPEKYKEITRGGDIEKVLQGIQAAKKSGLSPIKINVVKEKKNNKKEISELRDFCHKEGLELRFINQMSLEAGNFSQVEGGSSGYCPTCNRIRLMANGNLKPCLFSNEQFSIKEHGIETAYRLALRMKPEKGTVNTNHQFYNIGG